MAAATDEVGHAGIPRSHEIGRPATAAQRVVRPRRCRTTQADAAVRRTRFGRAIGSDQAAKRKLPGVYVAVKPARPLVHGTLPSFEHRADSAAPPNTAWS